MDVIVDTNIYASDFQMLGAKFQSLFDYLKRTNGTLILLEPVRTEVLALYERQLNENLSKAQSAWTSLARISSYIDDFHGVDIDSEVKLLGDRVSNNLNGAKVELFTAQIDINEIVRRGALRIPPANNKGEELRDVIIWFQVLEYVKRVSTETAFISNDNGFWEGQLLKDPIKLDLAPIGDRLKIYRDLDSFIEGNNLTSTAIDELWLAPYIGDVDPLKDQISDRILTVFKYGYPGYDFEISIDAIEFAKGKAYQVSSASSFVEVSFKFSASIISTPTSDHEFYRLVLFRAMLSVPRQDNVDRTSRYPPTSEFGYANFTMRVVNSVSSDAELDTLNLS